MRIVLISLDWDLIDLVEMLPELEFEGVIDHCGEGEVNGIRLLGADSNWTKLKSRYPDLRVIMAVDPPLIKKRLFDFYGKEALQGLVSPLAHVSKRSSVDASAIIQHGAKIMPLARLGKCCKIHMNASIHHESIIGDFSTIAPGAQILGNVTIGEAVYVGAGAVIRQRCRIGDNSTIGAGAVVIEDVPPGACVVGVPAKRNLQAPVADEVLTNNSK